LVGEEGIKESGGKDRGGGGGDENQSCGKGGRIRVPGPEERKSAEYEGERGKKQLLSSSRCRKKELREWGTGDEGKKKLRKKVSQGKGDLRDLRGTGKKEGAWISSQFGEVRC